LFSKIPDHGDMDMAGSHHHLVAILAMLYACMFLSDVKKLHIDCDL
jgi:hypothetical protein